MAWHGMAAAVAAGDKLQVTVPPWRFCARDHIQNQWTNAHQLRGSPPIKVGWLCKSKSLRPIALGSWNFLCRFQHGMALSGNFCGPMHYVLPGEKTQNTTFAAPVRLRLVSKNHKKLIQFFYETFILTGAAKMGEKEFFLNLKIIFFIFLLVRIVSFTVISFHTLLKGGTCYQKMYK